MTKVTYEETQRLLRAPYESGPVATKYGIRAFGVDLAEGDPIEFRTFCNDPAYAELRVRDESGAVVGVYTETWDRIRRSGPIGSGKTGSRGDRE